MPDVERRGLSDARFWTAPLCLFPFFGLHLPCASSWCRLVACLSAIYPAPLFPAASILCRVAKVGLLCCGAGGRRVGGESGGKGAASAWNLLFSSRRLISLVLSLCLCLIHTHAHASHTHIAHTHVLSVSLFVSSQTHTAFPSAPQAQAVDPLSLFSLSLFLSLSLSLSVPASRNTAMTEYKLVVVGGACVHAGFLVFSIPSFALFALLFGSLRRKERNAVKGRRASEPADAHTHTHTHTHTHIHTHRGRERQSAESERRQTQKLVRFCFLSAV